jgi:hypothetical protein
MNLWYRFEITNEAVRSQMYTLFHYGDKNSLPKDLFFSKD